MRYRDLRPDEFIEGYIVLQKHGDEWRNIGRVKGWPRCTYEKFKETEITFLRYVDGTPFFYKDRYRIVRPREIYTNEERIDP